jgi:hypothetical protein
LAAQAAVAQTEIVTPGAGKELFLLHAPGGWMVSRFTNENGRQFCDAEIIDWDVTRTAHPLISANETPGLRQL